jgi:ADP-heptose:LPS heptosyltransferase
MGYGGDILLSAALQDAAQRSHEPIVIVHRPPVSDLLAGRLYDSRRSYSVNPVLGTHPAVGFNHALDVPRPRWVEWLNWFCWAALSVLGLVPAYERILESLSNLHYRLTRRRYLQIDCARYSYAAKMRRDRIIWKRGPHAIDAILSSFPKSLRPNAPLDDPKGVLNVESEREFVNGLLRQHGLQAGEFIVIEPVTNTDWFGDLRAWPLQRWDAMVGLLRRSFPNVKIVQIGLPGGSHIEGVIDLCGATTFLQAAALIKVSRLLIGTEGGLMHAARAVDAEAVIIWGGITLPAFAGYARRHLILFHPVSCAPCGLLGSCPYDKRCINGIGIDHVFAAVAEVLNNRKTFGVREVSERSLTTISQPAIV